MLVAAVATVAVDIVFVVVGIVVVVAVFLFLLVLLVLPFTYPSSRLIPPQIFPLQYRGHKEVEDVMHAGRRDVFLLPGYKSSARKKVVKFVVAISCGKKFA
ncbi:hypothetical protein ALC56_03164 [Trachymyrmex septentrionalis]|uniref:Uncharacterized protein n=1 Tax=Trachymyrmex septentrionalis TaxID=34720 RepID=A0A151JZT4_9HYME|nr:hypothetical protein ALC56_03164 [Trachymyrmex septentrionalis]